MKETVDTSPRSAPRWAGVAMLLAGLVLPGAAMAAEIAGEDGPSGALPPAAREVDLDEHLGRRIRADLGFTDMDGRPVRLSEYFSGDKPVVLVLAYYRCPALCGMELSAIADGLAKLDWKLGEHYRALTISFDPKDTPEAAARKRHSTLAALGRAAGAGGWPFLVSGEAEARALADDLGFRFAYDPQTDQYAHPAVAFALTPDGRISRYLYGVDVTARDLRLALLEASEGRIGTLTERVIMTCYRYDPATRRYGPYLLGFIRLGGLVILAAVCTVLGVLWCSERRRPRVAPGRRARAASHR